MARRPSRSDFHLQPDEARKVEEEARRYFEVLLPKRHPKPSRSEPFSDDLAAGRLQPSAGVPIPPEFVKLQELSADPQASVRSQKLVCEGVEVAEDYVQTEYYAGLHSIDKHHHTLISLSNMAGRAVLLTVHDASLTNIYVLNMIFSIETLPQLLFLFEELHRGDDAQEVRCHRQVIKVSDPNRVCLPTHRTLANSSTCCHCSSLPASITASLLHLILRNMLCLESPTFVDSITDWLASIFILGSYSGS
ncbi:hypothetical protein AXF42_Ash021051 [Apostasia shenzhenica]|uniref:Uncharacterized protein n=1 Tax=Apostasia shenzhenica TaxID=1088818 RepID=A0A2H9ZZD9_9ASPA|nr:hypothetical protein AXF42_Ash021051 [Apostasia shenzhenica]